LLSVSTRTRLPSARSAIGIAPVALGLPSGLVRDNARDPALSLLSRLDHRSGCSIGCGTGYCLVLGRLSAHLLLLLLRQPCTFAGRPPLLTGRRERQVLFLPDEPGRLCRLLCGTIGLEERSLGLDRGTAPVKEIIVSRVSQISVPFDVLSARMSDPEDWFGRDDRSGLLAIFPFLCQTGCLQPQGLFLAGLGDGVQLLKGTFPRKEPRKEL